VIHQLAPCKVGLKKKNKFTPTKSNTKLSPQNQSHKSRRKNKAEKKQQLSVAISSRKP
jgi:hypothetical protein